MSKNQERTEILNAFYSAPTEAVFNQKIIAQVIGCSCAWLERDRWLMVKTGRGEIPFKKFGRSVRYRKSDVLAWLAHDKNPIHSGV